MDLSLRVRVRAGDPDAFGALFDECARAVYNHAFRLTGNWSTAEEVVSLTFLEAWRLRSTVQPDGGSLRPWILGIAVNVTRNVSRAARRHQAAVGRLPPASPLPDFADDLAARIDDVARLAAVHSALGKLRRSEREVLTLCLWSGLDYAAAAAALQVPVGTVRSRLFRARRKLRDLAPAGDWDPGGEKLRPRNGQVSDSRENAARPMQERTR